MPGTKLIGKPQFQGTHASSGGMVPQSEVATAAMSALVLRLNSSPSRNPPFRTSNQLLTWHQPFLWDVKPPRGHGAYQSFELTKPPLGSTDKARYNQISIYQLRQNWNNF
jgi:hypothetical protein